MDYTQDNNAVIDASSHGSDTGPSISMPQTPIAREDSVVASLRCSGQVSVLEAIEMGPTAFPRISLVTLVTVLLIAGALTLLPVAGDLAWATSAPSRDDASQEPAEDVDAWRQKVETVLTDLEAREWEGLLSAEEISEFVQRFWERRDPTPGTPQNEFRDIFMQRVAAAERDFSEEGPPGYSTDRGKVLVIYGAPKEIEFRRTARDREDGGVAARGPEIVWRYAEENPYLTGVEAIRFSSSDGSSFSRQTELELNSDAFLASIQARLAANLVGRTTAAAAAAAAVAPEMAATEDSSEVVDPSSTWPPEFVALRQLVQGGVERREIGLQYRAHYFPAPDSNTYTLLAFEVARSGLSFPVNATAPEAFDDAVSSTAAAGGAMPSDATSDGLPGSAAEPPDSGQALTEIPESGSALLNVFGVILQEISGTTKIMYQFNMPLVMEPGADVGPSDAPEGDEGAVGGSEPDSETHSFGVTLTPGSYRLAWGVMDSNSGKISALDVPLEAPDFTAAELTLSSVLLARSIEKRTDELQLDKIYEGVRLGGLLVRDDVDRLFGRDDTMELLYVVGGAELEAASQKARLEIDYRILVAADGHSIARLPTQTLDYTTIGQQIPLGQIRQIQPGEGYQLEVTVRDLVAGTDIKQAIPFWVQMSDTSR